MRLLPFPSWCASFLCVCVKNNSFFLIPRRDPKQCFFLANELCLEFRQVTLRALEDGDMEAFARELA